MKKHAVRIALGLALLAVFVGHAADFYRLHFVAQLDHILYDYRLKLTAPGGVDDRVVILDIDEKSLADPELGRWPWGRDRMAAIVDRLFDQYAVRVLGFDVVNVEPDRSGGLDALDRLARGELASVPEFQQSLDRIRPELDHDGRFARAIQGRPVVLGYYFSSDSSAGAAGVLPKPALPAGSFAGRSIAFTSWEAYGANLPEFQAAARTAGHFNSLVDFDGVTRRVPMLADYKGAYYESLSLAVARVYLDAPDIVPGFAPSRFLSRSYAGLEWLEAGSLRIPVDENVSALVPYRGGRGSFRYVSLADVYHGRVPADSLRGRIALVGTSTPTLFDLRATPVGEVYPGVEIHANLIAGMLDGNLKHKPQYMVGAEIMVLLLIGGMLAILVPFLSPFRATALSALAALGAVGVSVGLWTHGGLVLPLAGTLLAVVGIYALNMSYGYFVESRSKRQFTELFGRYVPPELVDQMARDPGRYSMEGRSETLTILFSDIRGFTTMSEGLEPNELRALLNDYLTEMSMVIGGSRGTLDKYIGDAIMAFWGAPVAEPEHARKAVHAAIAMQKALARLRPEYRARGWPEIRIGIGINTGPVYVGDMGSRLRRAYTVIGDPVNVASRLEGLTKRYGVEIIVGEETREAVPDIVFRELDRVRVKGKGEALGIFEPIGREGEIARERQEELRLWSQALRAYRGQDWDQADVALFNLMRLYPDTGLYSLYAERVRRYRSEPPGAGWNGITAFDEK